MRFSARLGFKKPKTALQVRSMDDDLRTSLWNVVYTRLSNHRRLRSALSLLFTDLLKRPIDELPSYPTPALKAVREIFFGLKFYEVYDFLEFLTTQDHYPSQLAQQFNEVLTRECSAYRFVGQHLTPITSETELSAIEEALVNTSEMKGVHAHLGAALGKLSDRKNPDYRNSIKESISAVEGLAKIISGDHKATLGAALKVLESQRVIHPALKNGFSSIYGYANDGDGIRHAMLEEPDLTFADAKFMHLACVAFINYLIEKCSELGIALKEV